jgi:hypothetical protein
LTQLARAADHDPKAIPWGASMRHFKTALAIAAPLFLAGCFKSDYPLLNIFNSSTPIGDGRYVLSDLDKDGKPVPPKEYVVTHDLTTTKMISTKDDGSIQVANLLIHELGDNFYIVMDASNDYSLIHVNPKAILEFDESKNCDDLIDLAKSEGKDISAYGVASVDGDSSHTCKFTSLDGLETAFGALANANKIVINHIYKPAG